MNAIQKAINEKLELQETTIEYLRKQLAVSQKDNEILLEENQSLKAEIEKLKEV